MVRVYHEAAVNVAIRLSVLDCAACGIVYGITTELEARRRQDGETFYCPNGHRNHWGETEADKKIKAAQREAERLRRSLALAERLEREAQERAKTAERSLSATRGQVTKLRKRIGAGVCPYCQRHFTALERHCKTKHPDQPLPVELVS